MTLTNTKLEKVQLTGTKIPLVITEKVLNQIKYLCREIPKVEWSGILFYKVEGSIKDASTMRIVLEEILPMHKGTGTFTEYSFDEKVIDHMMDNEHLEDCKMGHIHSHNTMNVFFSGTDWSELEDNAPNHNFYLSLIVNNFMEFCAKVAFIAKPSNLCAKDEEGKDYSLVLSGTTSVDKLLTYDCEIITPTKEITVDEDFSKKVVGIIEDAAKRPVTTITSTPQTYSRVSNPVEDDWGDWNTPTKPQDLPYDMEQISEQFSIYVLNLEGTSRVFHSVPDIIKYHKSKYIDGRTLAKGVLNTYFESYKKFFEGTKIVDDAEMYVDITNLVIENLEDEMHASTLPFMIDMSTPTIDSLKSMLKHFIKQA